MENSSCFSTQSFSTHCAERHYKTILLATLLKPTDESPAVLFDGLLDGAGYALTPRLLENSFSTQRTEAAEIPALQNDSDGHAAAANR